MTIFLVIGAAGGAFLLLSLVLGDLFDGIFDGFGGELFSGAALGGFVAVFGFVGALVLSISEGSTVLAIIIGLLAGLAVGVGTGWLTVRLKAGGDEGNVKSANMVGATGTVISDIPAQGYGEVSVVINGHITKLNARSASEVTAGTPVEVSAVLSATAVQVRPIEE